MSMISIEVGDINIAALAPDRLRAAIRGGLQIAGGIIAAEMKQQAPGGLTSTLIDSIHMKVEGDDSVIIAPGVRYAYFVEHGRKAGEYPNMDEDSDFMEWVRSIVMTKPSHKRLKKAKDDGSSKYHSEVWRVGWLIGSAIKARGTKPNPFVARTAEKTREDATMAIRIALAKALT